MSENFALVVEKAWARDGSSEPTDALDELTPWELGIQKYLFEHNHRVAIRAAASTEYVFFSPDIQANIGELPGNLADLRQGRRTEIDFSESTLVLELKPRDSSVVDGSLRKFGDKVWRKSFQAPLQEVVHSLTTFITTIVDQAVAGGYVTRDDADAYLANRNP
jgi:hypothetical protein